MVGLAVGGSIAALVAAVYFKVERPTMKEGRMRVACDFALLLVACGLFFWPLQDMLLK